jgi:outer membrane protein TolC
MGPKTIFYFVVLSILNYDAICQDSLHNLSIVTALKIAEQNYPLLKAKKYEFEAANKNVDLNKNTIVPSLDISYQANLATANNITGQFYPADMIPMTGPVFSGNNYSPAFGSATSLLLNWEPFTFGYRSAKINSSKSEAAIKSADSENENFKHKINVVSTCLDLMLVEELLAVYQKNLDRTLFNLRQSRVLAITGLRPGVDTALFLSELSKAKIELINAEKNVASQKVALSKLLVTDTSLSLIDTLPFHKPPASSILEKKVSFDQHPLIKYYQSQLDWSKSREEVIGKYWLPKLNIWASTFARGSGVYPDATIKASDGWSFSKYNYGVGFQVAFPILKFTDVRIQQQQQNLISRSDRELLNQTRLELSKQQEISEVTLQSAMEVARETPVQLKSADYAFSALQMRYNAGLVNFADLIQAQYNLVKAETDLKKSYWEVWKALLYKTAVCGDLNDFLNEFK